MSKPHAQDSSAAELACILHHVRLGQPNKVVFMRHPAIEEHTSPFNLLQYLMIFIDIS